MKLVDQKLPDWVRHFSEPPQPLKPWNPGFGRDLHGKRYDRLVVVGFHDRARSGKAVWLVRCDCGDYELRNGPLLGIFSHSIRECWPCRFRRNGAEDTAERASEVPG